jgi:hypothetical protein
VKKLILSCIIDGRLFASRNKTEKRKHKKEASPERDGLSRDALMGSNGELSLWTS